MPNNLEKRVALNAFASSLRDQADRDYVSARHLYRLGFCDQFMWQAQQAIEKYLKATLLFAPTLPARQLGGHRGYGHNLPLLLSDVQEIKPWLPELSRPVRTFIEHAHKMGLNRYADQHVYRFGDELPHLDETVWSIRRWCQYNSIVPPDRIATKVTPIRWIELQREQILNIKPGGHQLIGGEIEKLIKSRRGEMWYYARQALIQWNRWFFGKRPSSVLPPRWSSSFVPVSGRPWANNPAILKLFERI